MLEYLTISLTNIRKVCLAYFLFNHNMNLVLQSTFQFTFALIGGVLNFELGTDVRPEVSTTTL